MIAEWVTTIAALLTMTAAVQSSPAPTASPAMKTITRVKSSPVCTEFRSLVLPLAMTQIKNRRLMQAIGEETQAYKKYSDSIFRNGMLLHASNVDIAATTILQNLAAMDKMLADSWKRSPRGVNPKIDALRQRVQNIVDLQRAVANQEVQFGGYVQDTDGMDTLASASDAFRRGGRLEAPSPPPNAVQVAASAPPPPPPQDAVSAPSYVAGLSSPNSDLLPEVDPRVPSTMPAGIAARTARYNSFRSLQNALQQESISLTPVASALAHDCDGVGP
jgi:hypothetical protein